MVLSAARQHLLGGIRLGACGQHLLRGSRPGAWGQHLLRGSRPGAWGQHLLRGIGSVYTAAKGFQEIREKLQAFPGGSIDLVKQESGIAVLTVNNPARMNAFSGSMMVELEERVSQLEEWTEGKGLIIQGAAGTFCSGSDLNAVRAISNPQVSPQCCQRYIQPSGQSSMLSEIYPTLRSVLNVVKIYPTLRSVLNVVRDISNPQVSPQCCQRYIQPSGQSSMLSEIYPTLRSVLNVVRDISNPQVSPQCCQRYIQPSGQSSMLSEIYPILRSVNVVRDISNPQVSPQYCQTFFKASGQSSMLSRYIQPSGQSSMLSEIYPILRSVNVVRDISNPQVSPQYCQTFFKASGQSSMLSRYIQPSGQSSMLSEIYPTLGSVLNAVRDISNPLVIHQCCQRYIQPSGQSL
uniref:Uncharacterized protein n=1 Tax=Oncorhynchus kisutch TaxID=8019 RepID=A0A8C7MBM7_ONCKI